MAYIDQRGFTDSFDNQKNINEKYIDSDPGPYVGVVKATTDPLRMGRLGVNIPALTNTANPTVDNIVWCQYLSPFYGAKIINATSKSDPNDYKATQHSYGFWAIPPDIDTEVLVIFAKGETEKKSAFWIGCVQQPLTNQQVPGYGASKFTEQAADRLDARERARSGQTNYGTDFLPVGEKNRRMIDNASTIESANQFRYPVNDVLAEQLLEQGLIQDDIRGTTSSSAKRESPSQVFGLNTPGRVRPDSRKLNIGINGSQVRPDRNPGHSFVMDDGDLNGNNQLTRIRTASGHQLLMHDTHGVVYIANGSGNSWIEMNSDGKVMIYAQDGFNLRSDGNFDLHSGGDINFHAKHSIKFTAEQDLALNAEGYMLTMGQKGVFNTSEKGSVRSFARDGITSYTSGTQLHGAGGRIDLAGSQVHFNSVGASPSWGPTWLNPQAAGIITDESQNDVNLTVGRGSVLEANTKKTKTTVPNLVTHEPFTRAPSAIIETVSQWEDPVKWKKLSKTPGTLEYLAQQNRESDVEYIRNLQFFADQKKYLESQGLIEVKGTDLNSIVENVKIDTINKGKDIGKNILKTNEFTKAIKDKASSLFSGSENNIPPSLRGKNLDVNLVKMKQLSEKFTAGYNEIYNVKSVVQNLKTGDISQLLTSKVVAGKIVSVASKLGGTLLGRSSANNLPPSLRGTAAGRITQVATAFKGAAARAATAIGSFFKGFSDVRLKEDIQYVGKSPRGINIYSFKYKKIPGRYVGVMAQEVPWAREMTDTGYYVVDYSKVDVEFRKLN